MSERDPELFELALDLLEPPARRALEAELAASPELRVAFEEVRGLVSSIALAEEPVAPPAELRARVLASTQESTRFDAFAERLSAMLSLGLPRVRSLLADVASAPGAPWEAGLTAGNQLLHFDGGEGLAEAHCGLVRLEPGQRFPRHRHLGAEHVLVLAGEMEDGDQVLRAGDEALQPAGSVHDYRSVGKEPLVFVVVLRGGIEVLDGDR